MVHGCSPHTNDLLKSTGQLKEAQSFCVLHLYSICLYYTKDPFDGTKLKVGRPETGQQDGHLATFATTIRSGSASTVLIRCEAQ